MGLKIKEEKDGGKITKWKLNKIKTEKERREDENEKWNGKRRKKLKNKMNKN